MIIIDSIIDSVRDVIAHYEEIRGDLNVVKLSYQKNVIPNPLKKNYIVLNPSKITVLPYHDNYGFNTKEITFKIKIDIHCPEGRNPKQLLQIFSFIVTAFDESPFYNIEKAECEEMKSDSNTNSVCLPCSIEFTMIS